MSIDFGKDVVIEEGVIINVKEGYIGDRTIIRTGARIEGISVILGRECYLDRNAVIGGGGAFDSGAFLHAGDWVHCGWNSQVNITRGVEIGDEVGIGIETKIFTHGAYLPVDQGFPVQWNSVKIGSRVWLPNAWVNPGVTIGDNVVVSSRSLVNRDLPSGCLAGGVPVKVLRKDIYPCEDYSMVKNIFTNFNFDVAVANYIIGIGSTFFDLKKRKIIGEVTVQTELVKEQLRRNGIRFKFTTKDGQYVPWGEA